MEHKHTETLLDELASKEIAIEDGKLQIVEETHEEKQRHWLRNRLNFFALLGLLIIMAGWFVAGIFLSRISFDSTVVSARQSDQSLQNIIDRQTSDYRLKITYPDGSEKSFSLAQMGMKVDTSATVKAARANQHAFASRLKWWQPTPAYLQLISNDAERDTFISQYATVTVQPPTDASIAIKNGAVEVTSSSPGQHYGLLGPRDTLDTAIRDMQTTPLRLQTLSKRPAITTEQLIPHQAKLKNMLNQSVTFVIGAKTFRATSADIADWIEITQSQTSKNIDVTVNSGKVLSYINKIAEPFSDPPKAQVEFTDAEGAKSVLVKGEGGTDVKDKSAVATRVAQNLFDGKATNETLRIEQANFNFVTADAYDKWIEVDLTAKRMYAYEKDTKVRTFLISAGAPATPTVTGQYTVKYKVAQQDMRGQNVDGSSYFQPHVSWILFFHGDYSIHGNYWRPLSWFGTYNSSHGCVGLPDSEAQWIYSWAPVGTNIFIHS